MTEAEIVVERQLEAYNRGDYETFAACYHKDIVSHDLQTNHRQMGGEQFFKYYENKFAQNPHLHCKVIHRIVHGNLIVDEEIISDYRDQDHKEFVIYQVEDGVITQMWFTQEIPLVTANEECRNCALST